MTSSLPLLLLPGTLCDDALWAGIAPALAGTPLVMADLREQVSIAEMASDAISRMPAGRFALCGFSLGGYVAWEVLRQAGDRVAALALVNSSARPEPAEGIPGREKMMALAERDFSRLTGMLISFMLPAARHDDAALRQDMQAMMDRVGAAAYVRQSRAVIERADSRPMLADVDCPTLVVGAEHDKVCPPSHSQEIAAAIRASELHLLPATGHMGPMEQPAEVGALLRGWLARAAA